MQKEYHATIQVTPRGQVAEARLGNGYSVIKTYDPETGRPTHIGSSLLGLFDNTLQDLSFNYDDLGNMLQRHDQSGTKNLVENFTYDSLNRLTSSQVVGRTAVNLSYDHFGNIISKSDIGTYTYGGNGAGPHAVTTAGFKTYTYDANGNMVSDGNRTLTYTSYDLVKTIAGSSTRTFAYSPDRSRYKMVRTAANNTTETTYTFGHIEILLDSAGALKETRRYLPGGTLITDKPSAAPAISYLLKDHLGSLDVIVDDHGNVVQALSFDAWGLRRDTASWVNLDPIPMVFFNTTVTRKGFTGHEMLDDVGIIDMGGRIYDPRLGRFLQADPFIQAPMNSQSHNRYSYVLNNPLVNVDPSGFFLKKLFSKLGRFLKKVWNNPIVRAAVAIVAAYVTYGQSLAAWGPVGAGAAAGFVSGGIMTGSLKGAVMGALTGAVTAGIGKMGLGDFTHFAQGLGGGIMSDLQGGKFGHGFVSAGVGSYMGGVDIADDLGRYVTVALVGGAVSKMTGGKFANGAATAGFAAIVNGAGRGQGGGLRSLWGSTKEFFADAYYSVFGGDYGTPVITMEEILPDGYGVTMVSEGASIAPVGPGCSDGSCVVPRGSGTGSLFYASYGDIWQRDLRRAGYRNAKLAGGAAMTVVGGGVTSIGSRAAYVGFRALAPSVQKATVDLVVDVLSIAVDNRMFGSTGLPEYSTDPYKKTKIPYDLPLKKR